MGFDAEQENQMNDRIRAAGEAAGATPEDIEQVVTEDDKLVETGAADAETLASAAESASEIVQEMQAITSEAVDGDGLDASEILEDEDDDDDIFDEDDDDDTEETTL